MNRPNFARLATALRVATPEELAADAAELDKRRRQSAHNALKASGCPKVTLEALSALGASDSMEQAKAYRLEARVEVYCAAWLGPTGIGKSVAAADAARWSVYEMNPDSRPSGSTRELCRWVTGAELGRVYTHDRDQARDWDRLKAACVVVLDDLGTEAHDGRSAESLWELVDSRLGNKRPTMLTSNLRLAEFSKRYGPRILDRLKGCAMVFEGSGKSLRGSK